MEISLIVIKATVVPSMLQIRKFSFRNLPWNIGTESDGIISPSASESASGIIKSIAIGFGAS